MPHEPSAMLARLFAIEPETLRADLHRAEEEPEAIAQELASAMAKSRGTPEDIARLTHLSLAHAYGFSRDENAPSDVKVFFAASAAAEVVQEAEDVASSQETCAALLEQIDGIRQREGLEAEELWVSTEEMPDDAQELDEAFARMLKRATDTVFAFVLRRYQLVEQAELFESDRVEFEVRREVGRRLTSPPPKNKADANQMDQLFRLRFGDAAYARVHHRLGQIARGED